MLINRGQINTVPVTVSEQTTITNPYYLFEFISKQSKVATYCVAQAISVIRFDEFSIEEVASGANPLLGQVTLLPGEYTYNIYQQSSSANLDPTLTTPAEFQNYVETGVLTVTGSGSGDTVYTGAATSNFIYNG